MTWKGCKDFFCHCAILETFFVILDTYKSKLFTNDKKVTVQHKEPPDFDDFRRQSYKRNLVLKKSKLVLNLLWVHYSN